MIPCANGTEERVSCAVLCLVCGMRCGFVRHQSSRAIRSGVGPNCHASALVRAPRQVMACEGSLDPPLSGGIRFEAGQHGNAASGFIIFLILWSLIIFLIVIIIFVTAITVFVLFLTR